MSFSVNTSTSPRGALGKYLVSGTLWALLARSLGIAAALAANALLARLLPPDALGAYFLAVSIVALAAVIASFGLKQTIVRLVSESLALGMPGRAASSVRKAFLIVATGATAVATPYGFFAGDWLAKKVFSLPILAEVAPLIAVWIALLAFQTPIAQTFRGLHNIRAAVFLDGVVASVLLALFLSTAYATGWDVNFRRIIILSLIAVLGGLIIGGTLLLFRMPSSHANERIAYSEILSISFPLFVANITNQAMTSFSLWIAGVMLTASDLAIYGVAWKLVNLVVTPLTIINMTVQPLISDFYARGEKERLQTALRGTATLAGLPAAAVLVVLLVAGDDVLAIVFGNQYRAAQSALAILSIGQIFNVWCGSCALVLALTGHQDILMRTTLVTSGLSVGATVLLGSLFGILGIAGGVAAGRALHNIVLWALVYRLIGVWTHASLRPSYLRYAAGRVLRTYR